MKKEILQRVKTQLKNNWYVDQDDIQALIDIAEQADIEKIRDIVDDELWDVFSSSQLNRLHRAFDSAKKQLVKDKKPQHTPHKVYQSLFDFFHIEHRLVLTEGEMDDIVYVVKEFIDHSHQRYIEDTAEFTVRIKSPAAEETYVYPLDDFNRFRRLYKKFVRKKLNRK